MTDKSTRVGGERFVITVVVTAAAWGNSPVSSFHHCCSLSARGWGATAASPVASDKPVANTPDVQVHPHSSQLDLDKKAANAHLGIDLQEHVGSGAEWAVCGKKGYSLFFTCHYRTDIDEMRKVGHSPRHFLSILHLLPRPLDAHTSRFAYFPQI